MPPPQILLPSSYGLECTGGYFVGGQFRYEVNRDYDIFEKLAGGSFVWREMVVGRENARLKMQGLAKLSSNEFFAIHTPTKEIIARENVADQ